jgi:hypothetical protein
VSRVLDLLITHQAPAKVARMLAWWKGVTDASNLLIAHGGARDDFDQIDFSQKVFVDDPRLRTRDAQREMQSYGAIFRAAAEFISAQDFTHVYVAEYDHLPLVADLHSRLLGRLAAEDADVLGHEALRVDGTNQPHFLFHSANPDFAPYWRRVTCRKDASVVLSMFGSGSFWRREGFEAVAFAEDPVPMYLEIRLPTLAHHLGFRVRDFGPAQNAFVKSRGNFVSEINRARTAGAWTLHPVKTLFDADLTIADFGLGIAD